MQTFRPAARRQLIAWTAAAAACAAVLPALAAESPPQTVVEVLLADGRTVSGVVDAASTSEILWLRSAQPGIVLQSGFPVGKIAHVVSDGQLLGAAEFLAQRQQVATSLDDAFWSDFWSFTVPVLVPGFGPFPLPPCGVCEPIGHCAPFPMPAAVCPIASLQVAARAANWDADPEADGLLCEVIPLDEFGRLAPVNGLLTLELYGQTTAYGPHDHQAPPAAFPRLATASIPVHDRDFTAGPATYRLTYRGFHPAANFNLAWYGLVTARLAVPGTGVFQASDDSVSLRSPSWLRDSHQALRGSRYLPGERSRIAPPR